MSSARRTTHGRAETVIGKEPRRAGTASPYLQVDGKAPPNPMRLSDSQRSEARRPTHAASIGTIRDSKIGSSYGNFDGAIDSVSTPV